MDYEDKCENVQYLDTQIERVFKVDSIEHVERPDADLKRM